MIDACNRTIDFWIAELERYDFPRLSAKPSLTEWSLGQVYMHLIKATDYFINQIKICNASNDFEQEETSANAKIIFLNNDLPDALLEGPPSNALTPQPLTKDQLLQNLVRLKEELKEAAVSIPDAPFKGKTKHGGLGYFNAGEWLQFAEMHFRHHLRQKKRLDAFLDTGRTGK